MNSYTNIRYHIYKEFDKYNKSKKQSTSDRINEFSIPILTGGIVFLLTEKCIENLNLKWYGYLLLIILICLIYAIVLKLLKVLLYKYENNIKPNVFAVIRKTKAEFELTQEVSAAKFNYEVTYLVQCAYNQLNELNDGDQLMYNLTVLKIIFYVENSLRKTEEALAGYPKRLKETFVYTSMIQAVMNMVCCIIDRMLVINKGSSSCYANEISNLLYMYNNVVEKLNKLYEMKFEPFIVPDEYRL